MNRWWKVGAIFLLITNIISIRIIFHYKGIIQKQVHEVYGFEGEENNIKISGGIIIFSSKDGDTINGGKIQYAGNNIENIVSRNEEIYFYKEGKKEVLLTFGSSAWNSKSKLADELALNPNIGQISGGRSYYNDINNIKNNLYFSMEASTMTKKYNFTVKLNVKKIK